MLRPSGAVFQASLAKLLATAHCSQASFARLTGVSTRQVNAWCRGRAETPRWALIVAAVLQQHSPDALAMGLEEALLPPAPPTPPESSTDPGLSEAAAR